MITAILYFLASFPCFALFIFFIVDYEQNHNKYVLYYALAFFAVYLFTFTLSVPVLVMPDNLTLLSYSYIGTLFFTYVLILLCMRIQLIVTNHFYKKYYFAFNLLVATLGVVSIFFAVINIEEPIVSGLMVQMNLDRTASYITGILSLVYGIFWAHLFHKVTLELQDKTLARRMMTFSLNGLLYGTAGFALFIDQNLFGEVVSMSLFFISFIVSVWVFVVPCIWDMTVHKKLVAK